jgi:hypothetical protein
MQMDAPNQTKSIRANTQENGTDELGKIAQRSIRGRRE